MKKFFKMISVYLAAVFMLGTVVGCSYATPPTLPQLDVPAVTIDADGVASWESVDNALYYIYVIDEGAENLTDECCIRISHNDSIKVKAVSGSELYNDSEFSSYKTYIKSNTSNDDPPDDEDPPKGEDPPTKTKLAVPAVTIDDNGIAAWYGVSDASYYVYVINNGSENRTEECFVRLANNDSIKVKAVSGSEQYSDSDFSQVKTYVKGSEPIVAIKLAAPTVTIDDDGVATWNSVANASFYAYVINNGSEKQTASRSVQLQNNDTVKVKAVSGAEQYSDSDFSQVKTYVKPSKPVDDDPIEEIELSAAVKAYYSGITATSGDRLLGQVHDLITTTHTYYTSYGECSESSYVNVTDPGPDGGACEFYTQKSIMSFSGNLGDWNREHVWCKSLSNGMWTSVSNSTRNGGSDMHHIRPAECGLNSTRGNNKFGDVNGGKPAYYRDSNKNNLYVGGYVGGGAFEPLDKVKGDVARIVLYVYTHYNTYVNVHGTTNGSKSGVFGTLNFTHIMAPTDESAAIQLLIQWCKADPVDEIEITRNNEVYKIQGNRNPFIDHPEYVTAIWG